MRKLFSLLLATFIVIGLGGLDLEAAKKKKKKSKAKSTEKTVKTIVLAGEQARGLIKIDLNKNNLLIKKHYTVPKGKTLHIHGAGKIEHAITGNVDVPARPDHPIYGRGYPAHKRDTYAHLRVAGKLIIGEKKPLESTDHSQLPSIHMNYHTYFERGAWLEVYNLAFRTTHWAGRGLRNVNLKMYNCVFMGYRGSITLDPNFSSIIYHTILDTSLVFTENHPRKITKNVKIINCVMYDDKRASMSALWAMDKCDIYGRPFIIRNYKWTSVAKIQGTNYFYDDEFPLYLDHAFQEDINKGIRVKTASQPFNQFEGLRVPQ